MKNMIKVILGLLASISLISSAYAGELSVTGTAKATYSVISGGSSDGSNTGKGLGVANEIDFGAKGELDNGWTWNYQVQMDPGTGTIPSTTTNTGNAYIDDSRLEIGTNFGTIGIYVTEGGLDVDNAASRSVYGRPTDIGLSSGMADGPGIDGFNNIQYHLPAGLLPFGTTFKAAYANGQSGAINSANAAGSTTDKYGDTAEQYQITLAPIDGLKVGADYYRESGGDILRWNNSLSIDEVYIPANPTVGQQWSTSSTDSIIVQAVAATLNSQNGCSYDGLLQLTSYSNGTGSTSYYKQGLGLIQLSSVSAYLDSAVVF